MRLKMKQNGVFVNVADHKVDRLLAGGLFVHADASDGDEVDESTDEPKLTGKALDDRAAELDIEGRSDMTADEKRAAIAAAES